MRASLRGREELVAMVQQALGLPTKKEAEQSFFMNRFTKLGFVDYQAGDELQVHSSLLNIVLHD
jgi:hypothetical protein